MSQNKSGCGHWVTNLLTLLPGMARNVCNSMPNDQRDIFENAKSITAAL